MMHALDKSLRGALERTVRKARTVAEAAAQAAVDQIGVATDKPEAYLSRAEKALRNRLRTHGKQLRDVRDSKSTNPTYGKQETLQLVQEVAYEQWHRMLFARFLADNNLLMYDGVAITIEECNELASDVGAKSGWELAGKLAARMLPQVFKPGSPVFELTFAPEHQNELERLLKDLPDAVFEASDSLGWVYQFWQADNKDRINTSEVKIGADELPAVTQLFTEPYMVAFLLQNSLGAWWLTRHPGRPCPVSLEYLRTSGDGTPAAGKFEGWPDTLKDFTILDPCCGSGHFLVAAFLMLVPMRIASEGLTAREAVDRVLIENIHGLELDPRCVEIAVFAMALEAWRYPDASGRPLGVREIPAPHIACCGLKVAAKAHDWEALVPEDTPHVNYVRQELRHLHATLSEAPLLGSLIDPSRATKKDFAASRYDGLLTLVRQALAVEIQSKDIDEPSNREIALSAQGLLSAARLLDEKYSLIITNVPYLTRGKQSDALKLFCERYYPTAKNDLANVFLERCLELTSNGGSVQVVMPENWLFLKSFKKQREQLLKTIRWDFLARLGSGAFETISGEVVKVILLTCTQMLPTADSTLGGIDVSSVPTAPEKANVLRIGQISRISQKSQLRNPEHTISIESLLAEKRLKEFVFMAEGLSRGDMERYDRYFWEIDGLGQRWTYLLNPPSTGTTLYGGRDTVFDWSSGNGSLATNPSARIQGQATWNRQGIFIARSSDLKVTLTGGHIHAQSGVALVPRNPDHLPALWTFCESPDFVKEVRKLNTKVLIPTGVLAEVPFDLIRWQEEAGRRFPDGLPPPMSNSPAQWLFHGDPSACDFPLQVAVARLLGYQWPIEYDPALKVSEATHQRLTRLKPLSRHTDKDGIVCIPPVGQEASAADRLLDLLAEAYGTTWSNDILASLLSAADHSGKSLETWLRDRFFPQHCALFGNRPFIWQIWDGLRDGFSVLVNYHKLDYKALEALIYTYLGNWISRQRRDKDSDVDGAQEKLDAAEVLKKRLELILAGEAPHDIFVRWKPIEEQPIGWNPDLNDGVRPNIRPFLSVPDVGKRGAGVLRDRPNIKWEKDRGSDVPSAPWYRLGLLYDGKEGDRINEHHLSLTEKRKAREKIK
jgi:hypothetical protein